MFRSIILAGAGALFLCGGVAADGVKLRMDHELHHALTAEAAAAAQPASAAAAPEKAVRAREDLVRVRFSVTPAAPAVSPALANAVLYLVLGVVALLLAYAVRHYLFTANRLFSKQRNPFSDVRVADWPRITVLIAAHNEEAVIAHSIEAIVSTDYPHDRLEIMPVNDRSTDGTRAIIDDWAARYPGLIRPFHRTEGKPGKAAALKDACEKASGEILIVFDADYVPSRGLLKALAAPFFDPEVGAVMGRVVPANTGKSLLTRLLNLERSGGYQVDQQARMNLKLVPQYGGTVGGIRRQALEEVGGWREDVLAEDTDITYNLLLHGWKTVYQNRAECYEEVPESWTVRARQVHRWAVGHNQAFMRYALPLLANRRASLREKLDGTLLLGTYAMAPVLLLGWAGAVFLYFFTGNDWLSGLLAVLMLVSYSSLGNFAAFFEIGAAAYLDGKKDREQLVFLPFNYFGFIVSLVSISGAAWSQLVSTLSRRPIGWSKTARYRKTGEAPFAAAGAQSA